MKNKKDIDIMRGFTLIEMAIILVIIAIVVASITVGTKLIHASKVRSVVTDFQKIETAISSFETKYNALPGDMNNAQRYLSQCVDYGGGKTCNGDGDGDVEAGAGVFEAYRVFQHLSLSGMVDRYFSGNDGDDSERIWYKSKISKNAYFIVTNNGVTSHIGSGINNYIRLSTPDAEASSTSCVISARDAEAIDEKMDDMTSSTGNLRGRDKGASGAACPSSCLSGGNYNRAGKDLGCTLWFKYD